MKCIILKDIAHEKIKEFVNCIKIKRTGKNWPIFRFSEVLIPIEC